MDGWIDGFTSECLVHVHFDLPAICTDEENVLMIGIISKVSGGGDGLTDCGFADVKLSSRTFHFASDVINKVTGFYSDSEANVVFWNIKVVNFIL